MGSVCAGKKSLFDGGEGNHMEKIWLVLKHELITLIRRPSFLFTLVGLPLIGVIVFVIAGQINQSSQAQGVFEQVIGGPQSSETEGYVDLSGIIQSLPASIPPEALAVYPTEAAARFAMQAGEIGAYYVVPVDYLTSGEVIYVRPDFNPLAASGQSSLFEWVLQVNLLGGDAQLAMLVNGPLYLKETSLSPEPQRDDSSAMTFFLPYIVTILFYMIILGAASLLLSSVTKEKENRVMEVLMVSVTPRQLLTGKIIGLGLLGLLQTLIWVGTGRILLARSEQTFNLPIAFQLPTSFIIWGLIFFLLGYAVYASLMAGLGALVPNLREASQATFVVIMPLMLPMFLINIQISDPHGAVSTIMSLFPLTAPVAMMSRLSSGGVPFWQPLLAMVLLAGTAVLVVRAVAGMFRAQALLSGQAFSMKVFFRSLMGKA
jgi:ABC-2 type transport system permease protein